jgi:hypothetical protein
MNTRRAHLDHVRIEIIGLWARTEQALETAVALIALPQHTLSVTFGRSGAYAAGNETTEIAARVADKD